MKIDLEAKALSAVTAGVGVIAALMLAAPPAMAEPVIPVPPPPPPPVLDASVQAAGADPAVPAEAAGADPALPAEAAAGADPALPPEGVPHLASPENLPPGTVDDPVVPSQPRLTYLRELWHAMQTQEVSGSDALLLLTQRPLVANAAPPPGLPAGPQPPLPPAPPPPPPAP